MDVPFPSERSKAVQLLSQIEVEQLAEQMPDRYRALILVGAYAGLRWVRLPGWTRANIDVLRSRITVVVSTAVEVECKITRGRSRRPPDRSGPSRSPGR